MSTYLDSAEVAARLGVVPTTVRRLAAHGGLPSYRIGRHLRFLAEEVDAWVREQQGSPPDPGRDDEYRRKIVSLVDAAPLLTGEQADRIAAILGETA